MSFPPDNSGYLAGTIQTPSALEITAITNDYPAVATISVNSVTASNTYIANQLVKLVIPYGYGMQQANGLVVKILNVDGLNIYLDIDSRKFDTFSEPASGQKPATMAPAGSKNLEYDNNTGTVPFQSLNNVGN